MKRSYFIFLVILCLVCSTIACNVLSREKEDDSGSAQPEITESATTGDEEPESTEATASGGEEGEYEDAPLSELQVFDTSKIKSYRGEITMSFDGISQGESMNGSILMELEVTTEPPASHFKMSMEGESLDVEEAITDMEFYIMGDKMYVNMGIADGWMVLPAEPDDSMTDAFFSYQDITDLPPNAHRKLLPETVNGVRCWHYVFDETDFPVEEREFDKMKADLWISVDEGYLVKMDVTIEGNFNESEAEAQPIDEGTMKITFDMRDVNQVFTIELPPEAASAEEIDLGEDFLGDMTWDREDAPLPEDAEIVYAYEEMVTAYTDLSLEEARDFMVAQLEANGWSFSEVILEDETMYMADFVKGDETLNVMINIAEEEQKTSIYISID